MIQSTKVGFDFVKEAESKRGAKIDIFRCTRCGQEVRDRQMHMLAHDRRDEKARDAQAAREVGMGTKPLPGQVGLFDPSFVVPKPERTRKRSTP